MEIVVLVIAFRQNKMGVGGEINRLKPFIISDAIPSLVYLLAALTS